VQGEAGEGSQTGFLRERGEQREASCASKGNKAHGSIGCDSLATAAHTTDSSVEKSPGVDRRKTGKRRPRPGQQTALSVGGRAKRDGRASSDASTSKGTDAVKASGRATGKALGPDRAVHFGACQPIASRCGWLWRACSPDGIAPRNNRPGNRSGRSRNGAEAQGQPCGEASGAGGTAPVVARTNPLQSDHDAAEAGFGRKKQWQDRRPGSRVGSNTRCFGTSRLAGSSRRERVSGIGGSFAHPRPQFWHSREVTVLYPRHTAARLRKKRGSWSSTSLAVYEGGIAADPRVGRRSRFRQALRCQRRSQGGVRQRASASRATSRSSCFGTARQRWGTTTAGGQRPQ